MSERYTLYSKATGAFGPRVTVDTPAAIAAYVNDRVGAWPGRHDGKAVKLDLETMQVRDIEP